MASPFPRLFVEGPDDAHAARNLLARHGLRVIRAGERLPQAGEPFLAEIVARAGKRDALSAWIEAQREDGSSPHAIVLDANGSAGDTWSAARNRLTGLGLAPPARLPREGYVGRALHDARVGVWIMPDNRSAGALEEFLASLVPEDDVLWPHARSSTKQARLLVPGRSDAWEGKASIHAWLSWQERPGYPFGKALTAGFLGHDSKLAQAFVAWFRRVFEGTPDR